MPVKDQATTVHNPALKVWSIIGGVCKMSTLVHSREVGHRQGLHYDLIRGEGKARKSIGSILQGHINPK